MTGRVPDGFTAASTANVRQGELSLPDIQAEARALMDVHGLSGWKLQFDRAVQRAGMCDQGNQLISLSAPLMSRWTEAQRKDTILHEIAHALSSVGHGRAWQLKCLEIGVDPARTWGRDGEETIPPKYTGTCPAGHEIYRERLTQRTRAGSCPVCSRYYNPNYLLTWERTG